MGKGGYHGGSTVIGPWSSDWFGHRDHPSKKARQGGKAAKASKSTTSNKAKKKHPHAKLVSAKREHSAEAITAKRQQQKLKAEQKAKVAEIDALRQAKAKEEAAAKRARAAAAVVARRKGAAAAARIVPRVPTQGEVTVFSQRKHTRIPEVEVRTATGRRIKIETSAKTPPTGTRPAARPRKT